MKHTRSLSAPALATWLVAHNAEPALRRFAAGKTLATAWRDCPRGYWLLWLLRAASQLDTATGTRLALALADAEQPAAPDKRVRACLTLVAQWLAGHATDEQVLLARQQAEATTADTTYGYYCHYYHGTPAYAEVAHAHAAALAAVAAGAYIACAVDARRDRYPEHSYGYVADLHVSAAASRLEAEARHADLIRSLLACPTIRPATS